MVHVTVPPFLMVMVPGVNAKLVIATFACMGADVLLAELEFTLAEEVLLLIELTEEDDMLVELELTLLMELAEEPSELIELLLLRELL